MVSFTLTASIALLAASAAAVPFSGSSLIPNGELVTRQAQLPPTCSEYCSNGSGCVCIIRPTNCLANYTVQPGDNCGTIVDLYNNFTAHDLYSWNPEIGQQCYGLQAYVPVCINVAGYVYPGPVKAGDIWTKSQVPIPVMPDIVEPCKKFEYVDKSGNPSLATILKTNNISAKQWNTWNYPDQPSNGSYYTYAQFFNCVGVTA